VRRDDPGSSPSRDRLTPVRFSEVRRPSFARMSIDPVGLDRSARISGCRRDAHSPVRACCGDVVVHFRLRFGVV